MIIRIKLAGKARQKGGDRVVQPTISFMVLLAGSGLESVSMGSAQYAKRSRIMSISMQSELNPDLMALN